MALVNKTTGSKSRLQAKWIEEERRFWVGGIMPEIESFQESAQHCFEIAKASGFVESSDYPDDDEVALEAFVLLVANDCDAILAHGLGISLY